MDEDEKMFRAAMRKKDDEATLEAAGAPEATKKVKKDFEVVSSTKVPKHFEGADGFFCELCKFFTKSTSGVRAHKKSKICDKLSEKCAEIEREESNTRIMAMHRVATCPERFCAVCRMEK